MIRCEEGAGTSRQDDRMMNDNGSFREAET